MDQYRHYNKSSMDDILCSVVFAKSRFGTLYLLPLSTDGDRKTRVKRQQGGNLWDTGDEEYVH